MNLEVIKQVICDSIPDDVSVSNIDVKESGSGLTIKLTWEALKASAPGQPIRDLDALKDLDWNSIKARMPLEPLEPTISKMVNTPEFKQKLANECKKYEEDLAKVKEAYRDKLRSEIPNEVTEFNNGILKVVGEKVSLFRNGELVCDLNIRFNPSLLNAVQSAWAGDSPTLKNYDVLVVTKPGGSEDHYSVADVKQKNGFQNFSLIKVFGNALGSAKPSIDDKKFANLSEVVDKNADAIYKSTVDEVSKLISDEEDESIKTELEWTPIFKDVLADMPRQIKRYHDGFEGNFGYLLGAVIQRIAERNRDAKIDVKLASDILHKLLDAEKKPSAEYASSLIRAGIEPTQAYEWAKVKPPKKTTEGKIVTSINLKDPFSLEKAAKTIREMVSDINEGKVYKQDIASNQSDNSKFRVNGRRGVFTRSEDGYRVTADGYCSIYSVSTLAMAQKIRAMIQRGALKPEELETMVEKGFDPDAVKCWKELYAQHDKKLPDGYKMIEKPRHAKKAFEVVAEYKKACESYRNKFGGKPTNPIMGKRGVSDFSTNRKDVTDVEIMLLSNDNFTDPVLNPKKSSVYTKPIPPSIDTPIEKDEMKKPGKFKKILSHLKAIKDEILHG